MSTKKSKSEHILAVDEETSVTASTVRKGLLWQQKDGKLFCRWKERYFILTKDYLSCFKKASALSFLGSDMGSFLYKVNLVDVASIDWKPPGTKKRGKKQKEIIQIVLVASDAHIELWTSNKVTLHEWMFQLKDACCTSKGRREAFLKKSQTLCIPQGAPTQPFALSFWATTREDKKKKNKKKNSTNQESSQPDSQRSSILTTCDSTVGSILGRASSSADLNDLSYLKAYSSLKAPTRGTPVLTSRKRISVLSAKDAELTKESGAHTNGHVDEDDLSKLQPLIREPMFGPRLAPQCKGISSLVSLDRRLLPRPPVPLHQPCPRSLQVSPALAQRSIYAQHILSSPEIIAPSLLSYATSRRTREDLLRQATARASAPPNTVLKSATSDFSFIRPDSPLTLPYNKSKSFYGRPMALTGEVATMRRGPEPVRATTLNRAPPHLVQTAHHRPSSYHYEGENLEDLVAKMKLNERRKMRMNKILETSSRQFSQ